MKHNCSYYFCEEHATHFIKIDIADGIRIRAYCDEHEIGYEHILRVTKVEYNEYMIECEIEDLINA